MDSVVQSVISEFEQRSAVGIKKYGVTLDRTDLLPSEWVQHAREELMDMLLYLTRLKKELVKIECYSETDMGERVF